MTAFLAKNAGSSPSSFFRRRGQSLLLVLVMLLVFVAPVGAVNTGSLTRDAPLNTGPTNGDGKWMVKESKKREEGERRKSTVRGIAYEDYASVQPYFLFSLSHSSLLPLFFYITPTTQSAFRRTLCMGRGIRGLERLRMACSASAGKEVGTCCWFEGEKGAFLEKCQGKAIVNFGKRVLKKKIRHVQASTSHAHTSMPFPNL